MKLNISLWTAGIAVITLLSGFSAYSIWLWNNATQKEKLSCENKNLTAENAGLAEAIKAIQDAQLETNKQLTEILNDPASPEETLPPALLRTFDGLRARRKEYGDTYTAP